MTTRRKIVRIATAATTLLLTASVVMVGLAYRHLNGNITSVDTTAALGADRPNLAPIAATAPHRPLNILLVGSDSREGTHIGGDTPGLSDTTIVLHINADRTRATGVSIPRDSMVNRPACLNHDGTTKTPAGFGMFNEAFALGGIACTQRTVEHLTGIRIDHFAVIDLAGFEAMVDALDGVPICVPEPVNDDIGHIYLPAGAYTATGKQALGYVRERHTMSLNGDLGRMKRQQTFLASMANKLLSTGTLTNPMRLYGFLNAATQSLTTDPDLASIASLADLATEMQNIDPKNIQFISTPTTTYTPDPNRLAWTPQADDVWAALREDQPLPSNLRASVVNANQTRHPIHGADHKNRPADDNGLCT